MAHENRIFDTQRSQGLMQSYRLLLDRALRLAGHLTETVAGKIKSYHAIVAGDEIQGTKLEVTQVAGIAVDHHYRPATAVVYIVQLGITRRDESFQRIRHGSSCLAAIELVSD